MLKREITFEDFDGEKVTETHYFNLTKTELLEMQLDYDGGMEEVIRRIIRAEDNKALIGLFKQIVLASYGVRSDDGKRFMKSDDIREAFTQTPAYDALFMELATDDTAASNFISGIIPKAMQEEVEKAIKESVEKEKAEKELSKVSEPKELQLPLEDVSAPTT